MQRASILSVFLPSCSPLRLLPCVPPPPSFPVSPACPPHTLNLGLIFFFLKRACEIEGMFSYSPKIVEKRAMITTPNMNDGEFVS